MIKMATRSAASVLFDGLHHRSGLCHQPAQILSLPTANEPHMTRIADMAVDELGAGRVAKRFKFYQSEVIA
jgi:hypothetical protein